MIKSIVRQLIPAKKRKSLKIICKDKIIDLPRDQSVYLKKYDKYYTTLTIYTELDEKIETFYSEEIAENLYSSLLNSIEKLDEEFNVTTWLENFLKQQCKNNGYKLLYRTETGSDFVYVVDKNSILNKIEVKEYIPISFLPVDSNMLTKDGEKFMNYKVRRNTEKLLEDSLNEPIQQFILKNSEYIEYLKKLESATIENKELEKELSYMVTGVDKKIDYRTSAFAIYVNLKSLPFEEQHLFVLQNKNKILKYMENEIIKNEIIYKKHMRKIGDTKYFNLSNITLTRSSQVEFLFCAKKELEKILEREDTVLF